MAKQTPIQTYAPRILRKSAVLALTGWGETQLYLHVREGRFPKPIKMTDKGRSVAWIADEVDAWIKERINARDAEAREGDK